MHYEVKIKIPKTNQSSTSNTFASVASPQQTFVTDTDLSSQSGATTFPQMQERIRNAKERRREQQKKSEKLYMDTKKKGVKFYDKKGTGRLKDGKKVYD